MFSGIVEATSKIVRTQENQGTVVLTISRPQDFNDLLPGHSVCVNGVCLTVEKLSEGEMEFSLAKETLRITGWTSSNLNGQEVNLERSLQFGDRVHGHMVTGHVETVAEVLKKEIFGLSTVITFNLPNKIKKYLVQKGSVAINGVSLTVNNVDKGEFSVCLIPETVKRTNLGSLEVGSVVNIEADHFMKMWEHLLMEHKNLGNTPHA